jgi:ABC-type multidrug transport system permease subunit
MFYPLDPLPKWFRGAAMANPITWQIDCLRWATIGVGSTHRVGLESIAFLMFAAASFWYAARCLQRQE